jgi:hypothetical protein
MDFIPPASVRQVGNPQWRRFVVRDGDGHYWTGQDWSDAADDAMLFLRESEAMRAGLQLHEGEETPERFVTNVVVSVGKGEWSVEDLIDYLKHWGRFILVKTEETRAIGVEIQWDGLDDER